MLYVAIEGLKGVGKSTVIEHLSKIVCKYDMPITFFYPTNPMSNYNPLEVMYPILKNFDFYRKHLYSCRSNYHANKANWHDSSIIISDRSIITSLAVRWHNNKLDNKISYFKKIRKLEKEIAVPNIVIQLHLSENELLERYKNRKRSYGKYEENIKCIRQISKNFNAIKNWISQKDTIHFFGQKIIWIDIDCNNKTVEDIASDILHIIQHYKFKI